MTVKLAVTFAAMTILAACNGAQTEAPAPKPDQASAVATTPAAEKVTPVGFACASEAGAVEKLVCSDNDLALMDRELNRLAKLVRGGKTATKESVKKMDRSMSDFYRDIVECWKGSDVRQCTMSIYASQIAAVRKAHPEARLADKDGDSTGPFTYRCEGMKPLVEATFVNTDPGAVFLTWEGSQMTLAHVPSGSGAKYSGKWDNAAWVFWAKGEGAMLSSPGKTSSCKEAANG